MATQMQLEVILAGNRIATRVCKAEATKESIKTKPKSGNCFCIRVFKSIKLRLIVMSTHLEYRARERQRKRGKEEGQRNLTSKTATEREDLEREIKNKEDIFCWKNNMKIL